MFLQRLRIRARLLTAFAVVLVLAAATAAVGVWKLGSSSDAARQMMADPLIKERLAQEWFRNITAGVKRTTALAKSSDTTLDAVFAEEIKATTARTNAVFAKLGELADPEEKAMLDKSAELRKVFLGARQQVLDAKAAGKTADAERLFANEFTRSANVYLDSVQAFLDLQMKTIDGIGEQLTRQSADGRVLLAGLGALTLLVGAVLAFVIAGSVTRPVDQALAVARAVAAGDLSPRGERPQGDDELAGLLRALDDMRARLGELVSQVRTGVSSVGSASQEIASGNADLSQRTEQTASNLQQTASSIVQLTGAVKQSADAASQANQLATSAASVAQRGGEVVSQVVSTMEEINASSRKISDIIGTIDGIAFQTNILALNAAVEAARAGEQGRGFAVVAAEVRSLAQRSASAAREIKALIGASVERVEAGSKLVSDAGGTMSEIVASVQRVSDIIAEISAATHEQSQGIGQVNASVSQLDQMTQQNAALVEESAAAAQSLRDQASRLTDVVSSFRLDAEAPVHLPAQTAPVHLSAELAPVHKAPQAATSAPVLRAPAPSPRTAPAPAARRSAPAPAAPAPAASADASEEWTTF
ncbi:MAG: methyl-accepting chemotaxis protein [Rubrivivax sp.]